MSTAPFTSFVILTRNGVEVTRACVESIERWTQPGAYELVFVDNGSTDGTIEYLRSISAAPVVVIENDANLGFGAGCNQGIAAASGERILLLNNDVVVTPGWLDALHAVLDAEPELGVAGPRSNRVAGAQLVEGCDYDLDTLDGLDAWAQTWTARNAHEWSLTNRVIGFCMLVRREVLDEIGGFDLRFGLGNFEDDDICLRARVAGWSIAIVHDSFIHHMGSQTFASERIDYSASMAEGYRRFADKWRIAPDEFGAATGSYRADLIVARTRFDAGVHRSPLVAKPDGERRVELGADTRTSTLLVCADRARPERTRAALRTAFAAIGPANDVTVVVRIDPRDADAYVALDAAADEIGDAELPDVVLVEERDENDLPALRACTHVLDLEGDAIGTASLARDAGTSVVNSAELVRWVDALARRAA